MLHDGDDDAPTTRWPFWVFPVEIGVSWLAVPDCTGGACFIFVFRRAALYATTNNESEPSVTMNHNLCDVFWKL